MRLVWFNGVGIPEELTLDVEPGTSIGGVVQDDRGRPIQGVTVLLMTSSRRSGTGGTLKEFSPLMEYPAETDEEGRWRCDRIPETPEGLSILLEHPLYMNDPVWGNIVTPPLEELRDRSAVLVMRSGVTVSGTVLDPEGKPVSGATVALGERWWTPYRPPRPQTRTDAEGRFRFDQLKPGEDVLSITADGFAPVLEEIAIQTMDRMRFELHRGREVRGRVTDVDNNPVPGVRVAVEEWRGKATISWEARTGTDGRFRWSDAPLDDFTLVVHKTGYKAAELAGWDSRIEREISLRPVPRVEGSVVDAETGDAIQQFTVVPGLDLGERSPIHWDSMNSRPGRDGRYRLPLTGRHRAYYVRIVATGYESGAAGPFTGDTDLVVHDFALERGETTTLTTEDGLRGVVRAPTGEPLAGARVFPAGPPNRWFIDSDGHGRHSNVASTVSRAPDGSFHLSSLTPVEAVVVVHDRGYGWATAERAAADGITLIPWGRIEGVLRIGSKVAAQEKLLLQFQLPFQPQGRDLPWSHLATTDANGSFVFAQVPAGGVIVCRVLEQGQGSVPLRRCLRYKEADIVSGRTTQVAIGGIGRPVTGRAVAPVEIHSGIDWADPWNGWQVFGVLFRQNDSSYERLIGIVMEPDGSFRADDVSSGDYVLSIGVRSRTEVKDVAAVRRQFTVPEVEGGQSDVPFDLGEVSLTPPNPSDTTTR